MVVYITVFYTLLTMPLLAFAGSFLAGRFVRDYISHKQQMERLAEANRNAVPGEYLTWLIK